MSDNSELSSFPNLAIVGQSGKMGGMLARELAAAGYPVMALNRRKGAGKGDSIYDREETERVLGWAEVVIISVPVSALRDTLAELVPLLRSGQLLMDVTSVKVLPMRWMLEAYVGPVIGTHPMFGPAPKPEDRKVVLVRGENVTNKQARLAEHLFADMSCRTFWSSAEDHDRGVAFAQSLNFTVSAAFFSALGQNSWVEPYLTPSFKRHLEAARKHLTVDTAMFCEFTAHNPMFSEVLQSYRRNLERVERGELADIAEEAVVWYGKNPQPKVAS